MQKRGLSSVVAVILIVVLAIVSVAFIWGFISHMLRTNAMRAEAQSRLFNEDIRMLPPQFDVNIISLTLERGSATQQYVGETTIQVNPPTVDLVSVVSLEPRASDKICWGVDESCCMNVLKGNPLPTNCGKSIIDGEYEEFTQDRCVNTCHGTWDANLPALKEANKVLINQLITSENDNQMAIIGFDSAAYVIRDLTQNTVDLSTSVDNFASSTSMVSCVCCGIEEARKITGTHNKVLVLLITGAPSNNNFAGPCYSADNAAASQTAIEAANRARQNGFEIYVIGIGPIITMDPWVVPTVSGVADGPDHYFFGNASQIADIYSTITTRIEKKYASILDSDHLRIVVYNKNGQTEVHSEPPPTQPFERKIYELETNFPAEDITKIEVYPVVVLDSGEEVTLAAPTISWTAEGGYVR